MLKLGRRIRLKSVLGLLTHHKRLKSMGSIEVGNTAWPLIVEPGFNCQGPAKEGKAVVLGIYTPCAFDEAEGSGSGLTLTLTETAKKYNEFACNKLVEQLMASGPFIRLGEARLYFNVAPAFPIVSLVGLGDQCYGYNEIEKRDEAKEAIRLAVGAGARAVQDLGVTKVYVESFGHTESAAEGAALALWIYQDLKNQSKRITVPYLGLYDDCDWAAWQIGLEKASAQNLARQLMETPSNLMTPTAFSIAAIEALVKVGVNVEIRVQEWAKENNMNGFLAVASGSYENPIFLELSYNGCDPCISPAVLVGKGVTFDAGGLFLRGDEELDVMRGDMGGAATVVATMRAAASLKLPVNIRGIIPLCENVPGAFAMKPGDIIQAVNGKTVLIQDPDFEGTVVLADALGYAQKYKPKFILDVGTMSKHSQNLLGSAATPVFTNCDNLWASIKAASIHTGDRLWRLPLWDAYVAQIEPLHLSVDLVNVPNPPASAYTATAAAFLHQFVCHYKWMHLDTYGVMLEQGDTTYLRPGMSGRPTRTIIEFLAQMACKPVDC